MHNNLWYFSIKFQVDPDEHNIMLVGFKIIVSFGSILKDKKENIHEDSTMRIKHDTVSFDFI